MMRNSTNIIKYKRLAPIYDVLFSKLLGSARKKAFNLLQFTDGSKVLLMGVGTGEDFKYIPDRCTCVGIDISQPMLDKARKKTENKSVVLYNMNAEELEFPDGSFDYVVLNLILSVAENPQKVINEAIRVLKGDGQILVFDKFANKSKKISRIRLGVNKVTSFIGTDINRCFEDNICDVPLEIIKDESSFFRGTYRNILLVKKS
ncbi:class I SAM-dependent methyltransferase [Pseudobacteroides cellulosolvens]|uniref:Methyltransferase type 11 n=1 Tax=Pseudobacteroides cellulosolvens ATCC 35603 = DSM 2933 TaxID=398512 RepID=A0A0L6JT13_9FIRM|nr:methyltransferase domain-containing protein [Pseudobacteroides cellulosolvens]KNY28958.1 Methyltransferase type 11 [Pseudobacteroides cellulosolvens ATCC 35603 = DSM 2933]